MTGRNFEKRKAIALARLERECRAIALGLLDDVGPMGVQVTRYATAKRNRSGNPGSCLTETQRRIWRLCRRGLVQKTVAQYLGVTSAHVSTQRKAAAARAAAARTRSLHP